MRSAVAVLFLIGTGCAGAPASHSTARATASEAPRTAASIHQSTIEAPIRERGPHPSPDRSEVPAGDPDDRPEPEPDAPTEATPPQNDERPAAAARYPDPGGMSDGDLERAVRDCVMVGDNPCTLWLLEGRARTETQHRMLIEARRQRGVEPPPWPFRLRRRGDRSLLWDDVEDARRRYHQQRRDRGLE